MENSVAPAHTDARVRDPRRASQDETNQAAIGPRLRNDTRAEECSCSTSTRAWPHDIDLTVLYVELRETVQRYHQCAIAIECSRRRRQAQRDNGIDSLNAANPSLDIAWRNGNSGLHDLRRGRRGHKLETLPQHLGHVVLHFLRIDAAHQFELRVDRERHVLRSHHPQAAPEHHSWTQRLLDRAEPQRRFGRERRLDVAWPLTHRDERYGSRPRRRG